MRRFLLPCVWIFLVFLANILALFLGMYEQFPWLDIPMHFFGGYTVALLGIALFSWVKTRVQIRATTQSHSRFAVMLLEGMFVIGFVMIISVAWEIWEFLMDQFATVFVERFGVTQPGMADTMNDFLNDTVGAVTAWILWRPKA